jgi:hypothetical protein
MCKKCITFIIVVLFSGCILSKKNNSCDSYSYKDKDKVIVVG